LTKHTSSAGKPCFVLTDISSEYSRLRYVLDTFATVGKSISGASLPVGRQAKRAPKPASLPTGRQVEKKKNKNSPFGESQYNSASQHQNLEVP